MAAVANDGEDHISALPDDALHHILSFLPSDHAVRTCVLARRWQHLWRSTRSLRVTPRPHHRCRDWTPSTLRRFVYHFLRSREAAVPVNECDIFTGWLRGDSKAEDNNLNRAASRWIHHAVVNLQARVLRVHVRVRRRLCLDRVPLASPLLTRVELRGATFTDSSRSIDFSRCLALEDLTMSDCEIYSKRISSASLAHLTIVHCKFYGKTRTRISTPRVVSLRLSVSKGRAPLLEKMPLLMAASVTIKCLCYDTCVHNVCKHDGFDDDDSSYGSDDDSRDNCYCIDEDGGGVYLENVAICDSCYGTDNGRSVLLQGLSEATDLELISDPLMFILRKDCDSRTTFSKLRTLLLNEWCLAVDFGALIYFLKCSPVLEKLTLQLGHCETRYPVNKTDENPKEQLFIVSKQLKMVEIRCDKENKLVEKLLLLLMTNGVPSEQIQIEQNLKPGVSGFSTDEDSDYSDSDGYISEFVSVIISSISFKELVFTIEGGRYQILGLKDHGSVERAAGLLEAH